MKLKENAHCAGLPYHSIAKAWAVAARDSSVNTVQLDTSRVDIVVRYDPEYVISKIGAHRRLLPAQVNIPVQSRVHRVRPVDGIQSNSFGHRYIKMAMIYIYTYTTCFKTSDIDIDIYLHIYRIAKLCD